jgi:hypothetical protein
MEGYMDKYRRPLARNRIKRRAKRNDHNLGSSIANVSYRPRTRSQVLESVYSNGFTHDRYESVSLRY